MNSVPTCFIIGWYAYIRRLPTKPLKESTSVSVMIAPAVMRSVMDFVRAPKVLAMPGY